jgi:hypothetical protein
MRASHLSETGDLFLSKGSMKTKPRACVCYGNCTVPSAIAQRERVLRVSTARWMAGTKTRRATATPVEKGAGRRQPVVTYIQTSSFFPTSLSQAKAQSAPQCGHSNMKKKKKVLLLSPSMRRRLFDSDLEVGLQFGPVHGRRRRRVMIGTSAVIEKRRTG